MWGRSNKSFCKIYLTFLGSRPRDTGALRFRFRIFAGILQAALSIHNPQDLFLMFVDHMPGRGHLITGMGTGSVFVWHGGKMYAKEDKPYGGRGGRSPPQYLSFLSRAARKKNKRQCHTIPNANCQRPGNLAFKRMEWIILFCKRITGNQ